MTKNQIAMAINTMLVAVNGIAWPYGRYDVCIDGEKHCVQEVAIDHTHPLLSEVLCSNMDNGECDTVTLYDLNKESLTQVYMAVREDYQRTMREREYRRENERRKHHLHFDEV